MRRLTRSRLVLPRLAPAWAWRRIDASLSHGAEPRARAAMGLATVVYHLELYREGLVMNRNPLVPRLAPAWAWAIIDDTLARDAEQAEDTERPLRRQIARAQAAMRTATLGELVDIVQVQRPMRRPSSC